MVLGGAADPPSTTSTRRCIGAMLRKNGEIVETGCSGAVLGNPVTAVAWLANKVAQFGVTLEPGHVIMPGSCTRMVPVAAGDVIRAEFDQLGSVTSSVSVPCRRRHRSRVVRRNAHCRWARSGGLTA